MKIEEADFAEIEMRLLAQMGRAATIDELGYEFYRGPPMTDEQRRSLKSMRLRWAYSYRPPHIPKSYRE